MTRKIETYGEIDRAGKLMIKSDHLIKRWIASNKGQRIKLVIEKYSGKRSTRQSAYYWAVIIESVRSAINDLGHSYTSQEIHEFLKREFNYSEVETASGNYLKIPQSTTDLDTIGFNEYKEKIQQFASEILNLYIPDPNEQEVPY